MKPAHTLRLPARMMRQAVEFTARIYPHAIMVQWPHRALSSAGVYTTVTKIDHAETVRAVYAALATDLESQAWRIIGEALQNDFLAQQGAA